MPPSLGVRSLSAVVRATVSLFNCSSGQGARNNAGPREKNPHERVCSSLAIGGMRTTEGSPAVESRSQHLPRRKRKRSASRGLLFTEDLAWVPAGPERPFSYSLHYFRLILCNTFASRCAEVTTAIRFRLSEPRTHIGYFNGRERADVELASLVGLK